MAATPHCTPERLTRGEETTTLVLGGAAPRGGTGASGLGALIGPLLAEPLVGVAWDGRPTPRLASSWAWADDGRSITLKLHPDAKFHDGTPLTADLVKVLIEPALKASELLSFASVTDVMAVSDRELKVTFARPEAFLLSELSLVAISDTSKPDGGTGPFRRIPDASEGLVAFEGYYRGKPTIDFVELKEYDTQRAAWAALMRGEINALHEVTPAAIDFVEAESSVRTYPYIRPYYLFVAFNMRHPVLRNAAVRQALSQAVDRQQIINVALNGRGVPADGPIWPFHWAYAPAQRRHTYNREAATIRLDAAGFPPEKGVVSSRMPSRLRFTCLVLANEPRFEKIALVLQKQLFDIGVDLSLEALPLKTLIERIDTGTFDAFLLEWNTGRSLDWTYMTWRSGIDSPYSFGSGYSAANVALDRLRRAISDNETRAVVSELQRVFYDDPPAIFIAWPEVSRAVSASFVVPEEPQRDVMGSLWQWRAVEPVK